VTSSGNFRLGARFCAGSGKAIGLDNARHT
jgi:hypothetical protein